MTEEQLEQLCLEWFAASSRNPPKRVRRLRLIAVGIPVVYGEEDVKLVNLKLVNQNLKNNLNG